VSQLNKKRPGKSQKRFSSVSYRENGKVVAGKRKPKRDKLYYMQEEERLFLLEDIQERSIYELRERQEDDMTQQEVALYYSFLSQIEEEIQKQQELIIQVRQEIEDTDNPSLPFFRKKSRFRI
jgi:hypothetical protein